MPWHCGPWQMCKQWVIQVLPGWSNTCPPWLPMGAHISAATLEKHLGGAPATTHATGSTVPPPGVRNVWSAEWKSIQQTESCSLPFLLPKTFVLPSSQGVCPVSETWSSCSVKFCYHLNTFPLHTLYLELAILNTVDSLVITRNPSLCASPLLWLLRVLWIMRLFNRFHRGWANTG